MHFKHTLLYFLSLTRQIVSNILINLPLTSYSRHSYQRERERDREGDRETERERQRETENITVSKWVSFSVFYLLTYFWTTPTIHDVSCRLRKKNLLPNIWKIKSVKVKPYTLKFDCIPFWLHYHLEIREEFILKSNLTWDNCVIKNIYRNEMNFKNWKSNEMTSFNRSSI